MNKKRLSHAISLIGVASLTLAHADEPVQKMERIEVTGSSIKRIAKEGALPVQTLRREDIERSGATTITDLIQNLPAVQGFVAPAASVNGGGGGTATAALHGLDSKYTLVLLNGHRIAPISNDTAYGGGFSVNLESLPLSAIERVEVLTDGASALYGSEAVAGVINFITRKNQTDGGFDFNYNAPQHPGGQSWNVGVSKGFGSLDTQGFNILASFSHDEQQALNTNQRDFSKSGIIKFGDNLALFNPVANSIPAEAAVTLKNPKNGVGTVIFSPVYLKDGKCGPNTFLVQGTARGTLVDSCQFDFAATTMAIPETKRDSGYLSGQLKLGETARLHAELLSTKAAIRARFAPPAQAITIDKADPLYDRYVTPYLAQYDIDPANVRRVQARSRIYDAGGRTYVFTTQTDHAVFGLDGNAWDWDYSAALTHSSTTLTTKYDGGFMSTNAYLALVAAGKYNPFGYPGDAVPVLAPAVLHRDVSKSKFTIDNLNLHASRELYQLPAGPMSLGTGLEYTAEHYVENPSDIRMGNNKLQPNYTDSPFGGSAGALPFDAKRHSYGLFAELAVPVSQGFDVSGSVRYDNLSAVENSRNFDAAGNPIAPATQGKSSAGSTYKLSFRYTPTDSLLLRGSLGTGFRAPTVYDIANPIADAGVTAARYGCPFTAPDPLAAGCNGNAQYSKREGGNPLSNDGALKPERSKQWSLGFRVDALKSLSLGLDLWSVSIRDKIAVVTEEQAFNNAALYRPLFSVVTNKIGNYPDVALTTSPLNLTNAEYSGIDWDESFKTKTDYGTLTAAFTGTYMLKSRATAAGSNEWKSNLGRFENGNVTFRTIAHLSASLKSGMFTHTAQLNYRSGYNDQRFEAADQIVRRVNADGSYGAWVDYNGSVASYTTLDWQTSAELNKWLKLTFGIKNLADRAPPFVARNGGANQRGYDGRYSDPLGRQFYLTGSVKF